MTLFSIDKASAASESASSCASREAITQLASFSDAANPMTLELHVNLIRSYTKASNGPACPDIENEDLSFTSRSHRADFTNPAFLSNEERYVFVLDV